MKIRNRIALWATLITTGVFTAVVIMVMLFSASNREKQFYKTLYDEALTKANLYFSGKVDTETMHEIYRNNRETIDEVEVAIYDGENSLIYHDDSEVDIVKETPEMLAAIREHGKLEIYEQSHQIVGLVYFNDGQQYVVTAAAYDGYGLAKLSATRNFLLGVFFMALVFLYLSGYYIAGKALAPVKEIVEETEEITGNKLAKRLPVTNPNDELGELASAFNGMLDRLEHSFDAQSNFLSNISHELRTPLSALRAELQIALLKEREPGQYQEYIERALEDARNIEKLSAGLLDLARAGSDASRISMKEVRIDEALLDARNLIIRANKGYSVEIVFGQDSGEENWVTVLGNDYLLRTAFVNLIENNCKYSPDNHSSVMLNHSGQWASILFCDNGAEIPNEELPRIFDAFYRGSSGGRTKGHGIGMTLVKTIIELHGGEIEITSQVGEGTVFTVLLPHV